MSERHEAIAADIERGFRQAEREELIDGDAAIETLRQRRAERVKPPVASRTPAALKNSPVSPKSSRLDETVICRK
jgi:hypothetical protein